MLPRPATTAIATHGAITLGRTRRSIELAGLRLVESLYAAGSALPPHAHEKANVSVVFEGEFHERLPETSVIARSTSYVVKPRNTAHANSYGARAARSFVVEVSPEREGEVGLTDFGPARWSHGGRAIAAVLEIYRAFTAGDEDLEATTLAGLREVLARARESAPAALGARAGATLARAETLLCAAPGQRFSSAELARRVGVHPVYLARLFRAAYGESLRAYRKRLRVRAAARQLAETNEATCAVALSAGFADQSHLTRSFREQLGVAPATFRRLVHA